MTGIHYMHAPPLLALQLKGLWLIWKVLFIEL